LVGVPASAQQTSIGDAHTPSLHQDVSALRPAVLHAQQVGRHCVGSVQALPGAPSLQVMRAVTPSQEPLWLPLAIESASVTATDDELQLETASPWLAHPARTASTASHPTANQLGARSTPRSGQIGTLTSTPAETAPNS
jgi:hypothetical protein